MSSLQDTLDSVLCKYFHITTPAPEKEVCLTVYERKCKTNSINAEQYKDTYMRMNKIGKYERDSSSRTWNGTGSNRQSGKSSNSYSYGDEFTGYGGFGGFGAGWEDFFYQASRDKQKQEDEFRRNANAFEAKKREMQRKAEERKRNAEKAREAEEIKRNSEAHAKRQEQERENDEQARNGNYGRIRDLIYTVKVNCIEFNAEMEFSGRWGLENFVFYCGGDPEVVADEMKLYDMFKFVSNGKRYSGKLNISKLFGIDLQDGEHNIY